MNIGLIGVGKLGLAYALLFEQRGFNVWASSYRADYIEQLQARQVSTLEPGIKDLLSRSSISFTTDNHEIIHTCNFIYVMVATPSTPDGDYDISAVESVAQDFLTYSGPVKDKILVIGSTVNPGTCERLQSLLIDSGVHVVYCPTFSAQGTVLRDIQNPHTLSLGTENAQVADICRSVFAKLIPDDTPVYVMEPRTTEILKLAGNCLAIIQISFFNMIGQILLRQGLSKDLDTAMLYLNLIKHETQWRFGFGYGGPCYPRDNLSMVHWTRKQGMDYPLGSLIDQFNQQHINFLTDWLMQANGDGLPFYFDHLSYKRGVAIFEESHQMQVAKNLLKRGYQVYVEKSDFLLPTIQEDLAKEFGSLIRFERLQDLERLQISVYNVCENL